MRLLKVMAPVKFADPHKAQRHKPKTRILKLLRGNAQTKQKQEADVKEQQKVKMASVGNMGEINEFKL